MSDTKQADNANKNSQNNMKEQESSTPSLAAFNMEKLEAMFHCGRIQTESSFQAMQEVSTVEQVAPGVVVVTKKRKSVSRRKERAKQARKSSKVPESPAPLYDHKRHDSPHLQDSSSQENRGKQATSRRFWRRRCFNCGGGKHYAIQCHRRDKRSQRYIPGIGQCANCGNPDHEEKTCHRVNTQCFRCEQYGHYWPSCPTKHWSQVELQRYIFDKRHEDEALSIRMKCCSLS